MRTHVSFSSLAMAAALCATAPSPTAAQRAVASGYAGDAANTSATSIARPVIRMLATYDFNSSLEGMPSRVTVLDSAGTLVATFRTRGGGTERPMKVVIADRDILLEGETVRGTLTIVLYEQNDPMAVGSIVGIWALGSVQGELRAREVRSLHRIAT